MDIEAEIDDAQREFIDLSAKLAAVQEQWRAAAHRLGVLEGVYHGLSVLKRAREPELPLADPTSGATADLVQMPPRRRRAPNGWTGTFAMRELRAAGAEGVIKDDILARSEATDYPVSESNLRRVLLDLEQSGKASQENGRWYWRDVGPDPGMKMAGSGQGTPAIFESGSNQEEPS